MELSKNRKLYTCLILIIILSILILQKYEKRKELKNSIILLENEKFELEDKINDIKQTKIKQQQESDEQLVKIQNINISLNSNTLKNETEFKKIIYLFSEKSYLYIKEIGKSEIIWKKENYSLKYIFFTFEGDLKGFSEFLFLINKSDIYIDMSRSFIELTRDNFKVSLGYLEKNKVNPKEEGENN